MASRGTGGRRQLEVDTTGGFHNNDDNAAMTVTAASPTSSQGSWVVDPDEGWDGLGAVPVPRSPEAPRQHQQQQRRVSPVSSSLRGWAQVPVSPPAAEYPAMINMHSPPQSPGSVRSVSSTGSGGSRVAAGDGLVALARDQNQSSNVQLMDVSSSSSSSSSSPASPSASAAAGGMVPRSLPFEAFEAVDTQTFNQGTGGRGAWVGEGGARAGIGMGVGCTHVDDVNAMEMEMDVAEHGFGEVPAGEHEHAFVMRAAPGMTAAEAVEAIAEAAELRGITPTSVVLSHTQVSPSRQSSGGASPSLSQDGKEDEGGRGHAQETMFRHGAHSPAASYRSMTPPRNPSPSSVGAGASAAARTAGVPAVPDVDAARVGASRVPPGSAGSSTSASACIPMDATVGGIDVDVDVDGKYDGKHMDRLWRWTGLITAAKMGVIPIIVCATVAALSTQTGGGGGDRGEGRGGGGGGGGGGGARGGGGGGGTRCYSRRRPRGGGGGGGCFPDARIDRCGMPMPYCVAPSVACA